MVWQLLGGIYVGIGVALVFGAYRHITRTREWLWQDNMMTMLTIGFWPVLLVVAAVSKAGQR